MFSEQLPRAAFLLSLSLLCLSSVSDGLRVTNGSPCTDVCNKSSTNTTLNEIVCLDQQFNTTSVGEAFKDCIECELASTYADDESGETDVSWGLCTSNNRVLEGFEEAGRKIVNIDKRIQTISVMRSRPASSATLVQ